MNPNQLSTDKQQQPLSIIITNIEQQKSINQPLQKMTTPSDLLVKDIIHYMLSKVNEILSQKKLVKTNLSPFSYKFVESYINENVNMHFSVRQQNKKFQQQLQPLTIKNDNLCPSSTIVEQKGNPNDDTLSIQRTKRSNFQKLPRNLLTVSKIFTKKYDSQRQNTQSKRTPKVYDFIELNPKSIENLQLSTNDHQVQELRKLKQIKLQQSGIQKQQKKDIVRQIIKKDEKISFDFSGKIIKIKQNSQKLSLLSSSINALQKQGFTKNPYEKMINNKPINLDSLNLRKDQGKKLMAKRQPDAEFSNVMSLIPHLEISQGAKFIHNKAVLENKKKDPSLVDIKKSLSLNKISKSQFQRLKSVQDFKIVQHKSSIPCLPILNNSSVIQQQKSQTRAKKSFSDVCFQFKSLPRSTKNSRILPTERSNEKVKIENEELSEMLFDERFDIRSTDQTVGMILEDLKDLKENGKNMVGLGPRDKANLLYIKTGSVGSFQLPKVTHRLQGHQNKKISKNILQSKSRIKGKQKQNQFQRLKKHFQQKFKI